MEKACSICGGTDPHIHSDGKTYKANGFGVENKEAQEMFDKTFLECEMTVVMCNVTKCSFNKGNRCSRKEIHIDMDEVAYCWTWMMGEK